MTYDYPSIHPNLFKKWIFVLMNILKKIEKNEYLFWILVSVLNEYWIESVFKKMNRKNEKMNIQNIPTIATQIPIK